MVTRCLYTDWINPRFVTLEPQYRAGFLSREQVWHYARDPENDLPEAFVRRSLMTGDQCYGILEGDVLAAYSWYSKATNHFSDSLRLDFDRRWVYQYRAFTHPAHRGRRLHAIAMTRALAVCLAHGHQGLLICVEASNEFSLKSCLRMGYRTFGTIYSTTLGRLVGVRHAKGALLSRHVIVHSPGCRTFGYHLRNARDGRPGVEARLVLDDEAIVA